MARNDPNLPYLVLIAEALGDLCDELVFVGGCAAGLLLSDPEVESIRLTQDVDAVVQATSLVQYYKVEERLPACGFVRDGDSNVICRWKHKASGILFDLMPTHQDVLGFANRWYPEVVQSCVVVTLKPGLTIRLISSPCFIATKFEAYRDRGKGDYLMSHDLEDLLNVVDGRPELVEEFRFASPVLKQSVAASFVALLAVDQFASNALPGILEEADRAPLVLSRLQRIIELGQAEAL